MGDWNCAPRVWILLGCWQPEQPDRLQRLTDAAGWWRSGDRARLRPGLQILGRLDTAMHSGGETVFPEQLEQRLQAAARAAGLAVDAVLLLGVLILSGGSGWWRWCVWRMPGCSRLCSGSPQGWPPAERLREAAAALVVVSGAGPDGSRQMATAALMTNWLLRWLERLDAAEA